MKKHKYSSAFDAFLAKIKTKHIARLLASRDRYIREIESGLKEESVIADYEMKLTAINEEIELRNEVHLHNKREDIKTQIRASAKAKREEIEKGREA